MTNQDAFFTLLGDEDVDFLGDSVRPDVPVLTYRWSKSDAVAKLSLDDLLARGQAAMTEVGLTNLRTSGHHLRGDSDTGQRTKMTVLNADGRTMYMLMTAGMPGTRLQAKQINRQLAARIEKRSN